MARRRHVQEHENNDRWLVSYADFITLLFAFFVVMYAVSSINEGKMRVLSDSLMANFYSRQKSLDPIQVGKLVRSRQVDEVSPITKPVAVQPIAVTRESSARGPDGSRVGGEPAPVLRTRADERRGGESERRAAGPSGEEAAPGEREAARGEEGQEGSTAEGIGDTDTIADEIENAVAGLIEDELVKVRRKDTWLEVEFKSSILFGSGDARLDGEAIPMLEEIAGILKQFGNPVQVEGFTDNVPISTVAFPSNWELSAARAASVVHLLSRYGVEPGRMAAIGYGEHRPIADNETAAGRSRNRRVVLVIPTARNARQGLELDRLMGESSASGPNTVEPWSESPSPSEPY